MKINDIAYITINKNRGWRGLAELKCIAKDRSNVGTMVFSFSQDVWDDMQRGQIVIQDDKRYYVIAFDNTEILPKGQRSVLIKNFEAVVSHITMYNKETWVSEAGSTSDYQPINHFIRNRNNHTTSDWNYIGIRVVPTI